MTVLMAVESLEVDGAASRTETKKALDAREIIFSVNCRPISLQCEIHETRVQ